jgi:hypothetical protein
VNGDKQPRVSPGRSSLRVDAGVASGDPCDLQAVHGVCALHRAVPQKKVAASVGCFLVPCGAASVVSCADINPGGAAVSPAGCSHRLLGLFVCALGCSQAVQAELAPPPGGFCASKQACRECVLLAIAGCGSWPLICAEDGLIW